MAGNSAFVIRQGRGWQRGLDNFLRAELTGWFGTRTWLTHFLIWVGMIDGILLVTLIGMHGSGEAIQQIVTTGAMIYGVFSGMFAAVGVVIMMQDAIVGERQSGTAAWVLSKPISRAAFVLTKLFGNLLGILVMMITIPGLIGYVLISRLGAGEWLAFPGFLGAMGCLAVALLFYQTFTLMLGTLFTSRGAVIGLGLAFLFGQQFIIQTAPALGKILPLGIVLNVGSDAPSLVGSLILGVTVPSLSPVLWSAVLSVLFVIISLWRFERAEL